METTLQEVLKKSEPSLIEVGLQGQLKKRQLPYAMGDLFRPQADNRAWLRNADVVVMVYLTPAAAAAALLPSELSLPRLPAKGLAALGLTGGELAAVSLTFAKYGEGGTLAPYNEALMGIPCLYRIPCLYNGHPYSYCPYICVDSDEAAACGRELLGFPKKLATFDQNSSETQMVGTMERHGVRVISVSFKQQNKLFSVPLPENEKMVLPPPLDEMFALPEPTGKPQGLPVEMLSTWFIVNAIAPQHIVSLWKWEKGTVWAGKGSIDYVASDADPLAKLPVVHMVTSFRFKGDIVCYGDPAGAHSQCGPRDRDQGAAVASE